MLAKSDDRSQYMVFVGDNVQSSCRNPPVTPPLRGDDIFDVTEGVDHSRVSSPRSSQEDHPRPVDRAVQEREAAILLRRIPMVGCYGSELVSHRVQN